MREFVACWAHTRGDTRQRINWAAPAVGARGAAHASKDAPSPTGFSIFWYLVRTDARGAGKGEGMGRAHGRLSSSAQKWGRRGAAPTAQARASKLTHLTRIPALLALAI